MRYQVPQFIEVEDKIFGPFTFRQFVYLAGGAGAGFLAYKLLPAYIGILFALPLIGLGLALAFYKVNNRPFIEVVQSAFEYITKSRLYIWKKVDKKPQDPSQTAAEIEAKNAASQAVVPKISESKLKDLSWSLDINETVFSKDGKMEVGKTMSNSKPF